jgi:hypothetical protein
VVEPQPKPPETAARACGICVANLCAVSYSAIGFQHATRIGACSSVTLASRPRIKTSISSVTPSLRPVANGFSRTGHLGRRDFAGRRGSREVLYPGEPDFGRAISDVNYRYEAHKLRLLREILRPGDTYVDVGANIGVLSLAARTVVGERGRVICFEPMADNAAFL